jgi:predicted phosphodiesterase
MKRIALLADIHGNSLALDAVLAHIQAQGGVEEYWILGDLCAIGYDPAGVLERLSTLPNAIFIRGNTDRFVTSHDRPDPTIEEARQNPDLIPVVTDIAASFAWTQGYLDGRGWLDWLKALPLEQRLTLPDGTRVLLVHAAPGTDDGWGLNNALSDDEVRAALGDCDADLICVGHFHLPMERHLDGHGHGQCIVSPGSISNCFRTDLSPVYAILSVDGTGHQINYHYVDYDRQAAIEAAEQSSNPGRGYVVQSLKGQGSASWHRQWDGVAHLPTILR